MLQAQRKLFLLGLMVAGCFMVCVAALISNGAIERALLSDTSRSLAWGPTLFRLLLAGHGLALVACAITLWRSKRGVVNPSPPIPDRVAAESPAAKAGAWIILIVLSVVALQLRFWHLDSDLWYDELISLLDFIRPPLGEIVTSFASQNQHMLYSILAHASISLFGESAWAARLPAVLFGVGSLWALFLLGRSVTCAKEALIACALMTVSYHHIWFSQNARGYTALLFFAILATWLWLEALARDTWAWWIGYAMAVSLGMWSHMTMAFVVAAHGLLYIALLVRSTLFKSSKQSGKMETAGSSASSHFNWKPIVAWILCVSVTLQLHALALPDFLGSALHQESLPSEWSSPLWVIIESLRSLRVGFYGVAVLICGAALVGGGWLSIVRRDPLAGVAMVLPAMLGAATMLALDHYLWPRFFFFSMGFGVLIAVHGAMTWPRLILKVKLVHNFFARWWPPHSTSLFGARTGVALALLLITASVVTLPRLYSLPKQDFSGARDYIEQRRAPEEKVVAVGMAGVAYGRYFAPQWAVAQTRNELDAVRAEHANIWLVYTLPIQLKAYKPEIWNAIEKEFETVKVFPGTLGGGGIYVCRQRALSKSLQVASGKQPDATSTAAAR